MKIGFWSKLWLAGSRSDHMTFVLILLGIAILTANFALGLGYRWMLLFPIGLLALGTTGLVRDWQKGTRRLEQMSWRDSMRRKITTSKSRNDPSQKDPP